MKKTLIILVAVLALICSFAVAEECNHVWDVKKVSDATCTSPAIYEEYCSDCGISNGTFPQGSTGNHSYTSATTAPTCTKAGFTTYTCSCGNSYTEAGAAATGHSMKETSRVDATCTDAAKVTYTCSACGFSETKTEGSAKEHNWVVESKTTNCEKIQYTEYCSVCKTVNQIWEEESGKSHKWDISSEQTDCATITYTEKCSVCGVVNQIWTESTGKNHSFATEVKVAATCTVAGTGVEKCTVCGATGNSVVIPATGHTAQVVPAVAPTCEGTGLTEGSVCSVCGAELVAQQVVPAAGHVWSKRVVEPTETERGYTEYSCDVCDEWYRARYTDALGVAAAAGDYGPIVSDLEDNAMPYTAVVDAELGRVTITATANEDGTIELRELHISTALVEEWKAAGIVEVVFVVGEAEILVPFAVLETEVMAEIVAAFPADMNGYIITLDTNAVNDANVVGCLVKVDLTADVAGEDVVVAEDGIEMEVTDVITGMRLTYGDVAADVVGGGVYTV